MDHLSRGGYAVNPRGGRAPCRLEHHMPTSDEVGMREKLTRTNPRRED